jgi:FkbM family methyltransferase
MSQDAIKSTILDIGRYFGLDIRRFKPEQSEAGRLTSMLRKHDVNLVLDVGANIGQFALSLRRAGYTERIISFEPLSAEWHSLCRASKSDARWEIAPRTAIGDHDGEIQIHIAGNSVSSSVLRMLDNHTKAAPDSAYVDNERVQLSRLDTLTQSYLQPGIVPFLKIDTQGYEDRVLDGAKELLDRVIGLQLELSFAPLYEGQQLFDVLVERLREMGFSIWAIWPGFCDPHSGRMLQVDVTFFRN